METISIRLDENVVRELEMLMKKHRFMTITEFVRESIRDKMNALEKEELLKKVALLHGSSKRKTTDEQLHASGERAFAMLEKKHNLNK
mgnify:CR=1 FL=1